MIDKRKLMQWLEHIFRGRRGQPCSRIDLHHLHADSSAGAVEEWTIDESTRVPELAAQIIERASDDAESLGEWQKYVLFPFYGESPTPLGRYAFGIQGSPTDSFEVGQSEPPNGRGLLAQLMRHNEGCLRVTVQAVGEVVRQQTAMIEAQSKRLEVYERQQMENLTATEQLLSLQADRDLDRERAQNRERRLDAVLSHSMRLLPHVVGHLNAGRPQPAPPPTSAQPAPSSLPAPQSVATAPAASSGPSSGQPPPTPPDPAPAPPETTTAPLALVREILGSLREDQIEPLQRVLTPDQQVALFTLYERFQSSSDEASERASR